MNGYFDGTYYKHQKDDHTLCLIVGRSSTEKFIMVITEDFSVKVPYTKGNVFSKHWITLNIHTPQLSLYGTIHYRNLSPIKYDIMGPFAFFPMECRHGIISMNHRLKGKVWLNGEDIDFTGGQGYIEKDSGRSFPSSYVWIQANDFPKPCSIMAAVATIPFCGLHFQGCICVIQYQGKEYRLATYLGVRVLICTRKKIVLKQGKYRLEIRIAPCAGKPLHAPWEGEMVRTIREAASCPAEFRFFERNRQIFRLFSRHAGFEWER